MPLTVRLTGPEADLAGPDDIDLSFTQSARFALGKLKQSTCKRPPIVVKMIGRGAKSSVEASPRQARPGAMDLDERKTLRRRALSDGAARP
jgi:hypothetical protein